MKIKYDDFKKELNDKVENLKNWIRSLEHGYNDGEYEIDETEFTNLKKNICDDLDCLYDDVKENFREWLED